MLDKIIQQLSEKLTIKYTRLNDTVYSIQFSYVSEKITMYSVVHSIVNNTNDLWTYIDWRQFVDNLYIENKKNYELNPIELELVWNFIHEVKNNCAFIDEENDFPIDKEEDIIFYYFNFLKRNGLRKYAELMPSFNFSTFNVTVKLMILEDIYGDNIPIAKLKQDDKITLTEWKDWNRKQKEYKRY